MNYAIFYLRLLGEVCGVAAIVFLCLYIALSSWLLYWGGNAEAKRSEGYAWTGYVLLAVYMACEVVYSVVGRR